MNDRASAPGQYLGYSLQTVRFCSLLLSSGEAVDVAIEHVDDVSLHVGSNIVLLEQIKRAEYNNPTTMWSEDLWKTLNHWADMAHNETINPGLVTFRYFVSPDLNSPFIYQMHQAGKPKEIKNILETLEKESKKLKQDSNVIRLYERFLSFDDNIVRSIIQNFEFINEKDPVKSVQICLTGLTSSELLEKFTSAALGLAYRQAEVTRKSSKTIRINSKEFRKKFQIYRDQHDPIRTIESVTEEPDHHEAEKVKKHFPTFIWQLNLINVQQSRVTKAISDFYRTRGDIMSWANQGIIEEDVLQSFRERLYREYEDIFYEVIDEYDDNDRERQGRNILNKCNRVKQTLGSIEPPLHLVRGQYQILAQDEEVYWHPEYAPLSL